MRYCANCHVHVRGDRDSCPLCHNIIQTEGVEPAFSPYPDMPLKKEHATVLQVVSFIAVTSVIISLLAFFVWPIRLFVPLLVVFAMASLWLIARDIWEHHQIERGIVSLFIVLSILMFFIDVNNGNRGWALTYIIPLLLILDILTLLLSVRLLHLQKEDYLLEWLAACLVGMMPYIFIKAEWTYNILPSFLSVTLSVFFFVGLFIFKSSAIFAELNRRWHI